MNTTLTIAIGFAGTLLFLALAWWVWQRGRASGQLDASSPPPPASDEATQFIPPPAVDERTTRLPSPRRDETGTVAIPAPALAEGTVAIPASTRADRTISIPAPVTEEPTVSIPRPPPPTDATAMLVRRPAPASAKPTTEMISNEEIQAVIAKHRASSSTAPSIPVPAAADPISPPAPPPRAAIPSPKPSPSLAPPPEPPPPPTSRAASPSIAAETLQEHFDTALATLNRMIASETARDLPALAQGPEREWRRNVDVLALVAERSVDEYALPTLLDSKATAERRLAAASVLLELESAKGHERLLEHFAALDAVGREAAIAALTRWGSDRADAIASKGYRAATELDSKLLWLRVFAERALDPGPIIEELLAATEPVLLAAGLRLLPLHARGREFAGKIDRHIVAGPPMVRMAAIRAGLVFERPSAWIVCRQASRDRALPETCSVVAMLAPQAEVEALAAWASKPSAPAHAGWALGVSGRFVGMAGCIERLGHDDPSVIAESLAGFRHATGYPGDEAPSAVRAWWEANESQFARDKRYIDGEPFSMGSIRAALAKAPAASRDALRLELQVRSAGQLRLPSFALPTSELAALAALDATKIDLNRCWGTK